MSDLNKNQKQVQANESTTEAEQVVKDEEVVKKKLEVTVKEKLDFDPLYDCKIMESVTLCGIVSTMFRAAFVDFEGCDFQVPMMDQNNPNPNLLPTINLYFNHRELKAAPGQYNGVTKVLDDKTKSPVLKTIRSHDRKILEGDRYYLTNEGKEAIEPYLLDIPAIKNRNGEYNWAKIVSLVADPVNPVMGIQTVPSQYTQIKYIDPIKVLRAVFGDKDKSGDSKVYTIDIGRRKMANIGYGGQPVYTNNWLLIISRISEQNTKEYTEKLGLQPWSTSFPMVR